MRRGLRLHRAWLALVLLAAATALGIEPAWAEIITVTSPDDEGASNRPAPPGSLREAVEVRARPGDTIVFDLPGPVRLERRLTIGPELTGLTIQGPGTIQSRAGVRGSLEVLAEAVTIQGLLLDGVTVFVGSQLDSARGARIVGNTLRGIASVEVETALDCLVEGNTFIVAARGRPVISLDRTVGCRVIRNRIESRVAAQIHDENSLDLVIAANELDGGIESSQRSGEITGNRLGGREGIEVTPAERAGSGRLHVTGNAAPFMRVRRTDVEIAANTLQPSAGSRPALFLLFVANRAPQVTGDVVVRENTLGGGRTGLFYEETPNRSAPARIADNVVTGCSRWGIVAADARLARIEGNRVTDCGGGDAAGLQIRRGRDGLVAQRNTIEATRGVGIDVVAPTGVVALRANVVRGSTGAGVRIEGEDGRADLEGNTVIGNAGAGIEALEGSRALVTGGAITGNGGAGVLVHPLALVRVSQVAMGGNAGPGIDLFPEGVTDNALAKDGNNDLDWPTDLTYDPVTGRLLGVAFPGSLVEVFAAEPPPRAGNPENGEGAAFLGAVLADAAGRFSYPASGRLECEAAMQLTLTATVLAEEPFTSEFSPNIQCPATPPPPAGDRDGDGVLDSADQCPDSPSGSVNADGCADSLTLADGTRVYCNSAEGCSDVTSAGLCTDCRLTDDHRFVACPAGSLCRIDSSGGYTTQGGIAGTSDYTLDCRDASCTLDREGGGLCEGAAGACSQRFTDGTERAGCGALPCSSFTEPGVNGTNAATVVVRKQTVNGEGTFELLAVRPPSAGVSGTISTLAGVGDRELRLTVVAAPVPASVSVSEVVPAGWTAEVACPGLPPVTGGSLTLAVAAGSIRTCTVTNTRAVVLVVVPNVVGSPLALAEAAIVGAELTVGVRTLVDIPGLPGGIVVATDPPAGASLSPGTPVNLAVTRDGGTPVVLLGPERVTDAPALVNGFNVTTPATLGGSNGWALLDPETGEPLTSEIDAGLGAQFGALALRNRLGNGNDGLFTYGSQFTSVRVWSVAQGGYGIVQVGRSGALDATHTGGNPGSPDGIATTPFDVLGFTVIQLSPESVFIGGPVRPLASTSSIPGFPRFVSAFAYDLLRLTPLGELAADSTGWVLAITDGSPGRAYLVNPRTPTVEPILVGEVGDGPRSVRCLQSHGLCVVVNFLSGTATIILWDGQSTATIVGHVPIDAGAVTGSLRGDGANVVLLTSGFTSNTATRTTLDPLGSVVARATQAVSPACDGPAHALWLWNTAIAVLSCNRSNFLEVFAW